MYMEMSVYIEQGQVVEDGSKLLLLLVLLLLLDSGRRCSVLREYILFLERRRIPRG